MALRPHPPISAPSLLLLLILLLGAEAQPSPSSNNNNYNSFTGASFNSSTAIVIVILVSAFFFLAFFSIYMRNCSIRRSSTSGNARVFADGLGRRSRRRGLDPAVLETFPTLVYSDVKGHKLGNDTLECAVCLSEFSDDETLRLLPACNHVFHPDCIDAWLASHVTCPVCRSNLAATPVDSDQAEERTSEEDTPAEQVAIDVAPEASGLPPGPARFPRSHTTGHSVEGLDRFTLRLPEHVRKEIVAAGRLRRATSLVGFPAGGEASARIGYRGVRSERWARAPSFVARALSVRIPAWAAGRRGEGEGSVKKGEAAEGSTRGIFPSVRAPFDCLGGGTSGGGGGGRSSSAGDEDESPTVPLARV